MRDVNNGWLVRYLHSNTASAFFFLVYLHIGRGIYYGSYRSPRTLVWTIGTIIFVLMMATAFLGCLHGPKWFKNSIYNNNNNNNNSNNNNNFYLLIRINKSNIGLPLFNKWNDYRLKIGIRSLSTLNNSSVKDSSIVTDFLKEKELKAVYIYDNIEESSTRKKVLQETKGLSGVYLILNKITKDYYIGSASTNKFYARFTNHLINQTGSKIVKAAVRKYKLSNFSFLILELFPEKVTKENNKKLLDIEDFYLKSLLPNYNILTEAGSSFGYKHTEITRIKMKSIYNVRRGVGIDNLNKGKKFSKETIENMRKATLIRKLINYSFETISNMKKRSKSIILYNLDDTVYGTYPSITEAAQSINCTVKTIHRALKSEKKLLKKRWRVKCAN